jgi:hypothetical protein
MSLGMPFEEALTYFFGFIAAFFIITVFMMRMLHWPGADYVSFAGNTGLIISMFNLPSASIAC